MALGKPKVQTVGQPRTDKTDKSYPPRSFWRFCQFQIAGIRRLTGSKLIIRGVYGEAEATVDADDVASGIRNFQHSDLFKAISVPVRQY
jgi:hypothetical protein